MGDLPRSLQLIIDNARLALVNGKLATSSDIGSGVATEERQQDLDDDSFLQELARGEYSQTLYWKCVAEDCEDDSDWDGAERAYLEIVSDPEGCSFDKWRAHSDLCALNSLLGEWEQALSHAREATDAALADNSEVLQRGSLTRESWLLLELKRFDEARRRAKQGQALRTGIEDLLGNANLLIVLAACDAKQRRLWRAGWKLGRASRLLERSKQVWAECGPPPRGIEHAAYAWWTIEADRRRARRDSDAERSAWHQSIDIARRLVEDPVGSRVYDEARLMRTLLDAADALRRSGREAEATPLAEEAHAIQQRWKLPEAALHRRDV